MVHASGGYAYIYNDAGREYAYIYISDIYRGCVYVVSSVHINIYICVCVCAGVRVHRKWLMRLENMHIYTSPIFIVAVYRWYQVCI